MLKGVLGAADRFAVVDVETTGLYKTDRVVEIAVLTLDRSGTVIDEWDTLVNPGRDVGPVHIHGVTASMVSAAPRFEDIAGVVARRIDGAVLVAHNLSFDRRMLQQEFDRVGGTFAPGQGVCTLGLAGGKLSEACRRHKVDHAQAHRALGDARASGGLLQRLGMQFKQETRPSLAACSASPTASRTLRRDHFPEQFTPMPYLARLTSGLHHHGESGATLAYLDMLDWALADLSISRQEAGELQALALDLGLDDSAVTGAHRRYLDELMDAANRDGRLTSEERVLLKKAATALGFDPAGIDLPAPPAQDPVELRPGLRVCFTGAATDSRGSEIPRAQLEKQAQLLGMIPVDRLSKRACDLLVAGDVNSVSNKATKALQWRIPVVWARDFIDAQAGAFLRQW